MKSEGGHKLTNNRHHGLTHLRPQMRPILRIQYRYQVWYNRRYLSTSIRFFQIRNQVLVLERDDHYVVFVLFLDIVGAQRNDIFKLVIK